MTNPKRFWSFIKSKKQDNSGVAPLKANNGIIHSDSNNKAEILNARFKSTYTQEDTTKLPDLGESSIPSMPHITIREKGVHKLLYNLNDHKASIPDSILPRLLRLLAATYKNFPSFIRHGNRSKRLENSKHCTSIQKRR